MVKLEDKCILLKTTLRHLPISNNNQEILLIKMVELQLALICIKPKAIGSPLELLVG